MNRFNLREMSLKRIYSGISRRIKDIPDSIAWDLAFHETKLNKEKLLSYKDIHKGQRCFIIANGPSLKLLDLSKLNNEYTIGMNRIYLLFDSIQFFTTYYCAINNLVIQQFKKDISNLPMPRFLNWSERQLFNGDQSGNIQFLKITNSLEDSFIPNLLRPISSGGTVTFVALELAFFMGFSEVIIIGLDHNFQNQGEPNKVEVRKDTIDENHFSPNYFPQGIKWMLPDLKRSELAYSLANEAFIKNGRRIFDATIGGKCNIFPKVKFDSLF